MVIMLLVSFLVLFVTGLARGLAYANISAVENMPANYFVVQGDADQTFRRSQLTDTELQNVRAVVGDNNASSLAIEGDKITNETNGKVLVDRDLEQSGIKLGSIIRDQATGMEFTVAGFVEDSSYSHTPVVYINNQDWQAMKQGVNQGEETSSSVPFNVIALNANADQVNKISTNVKDVEVITQKVAISNIPGYSAEQGSLLMMIVFLFVIAAFVLAVFFYVITIQKTSQFGILKAMGTKMSYLAWSVVGQVMILAISSLCISLLLTFGMNKVLPDSMPFQLEPSTILLTSCLFVGMSLLGSLISVAKVAKVDALEAIGRAGA